MCCAAGEIAGCERGETGEVCAREEERIEPVDAAFVSRMCQCALYVEGGMGVAYAFRR